MVVLIQPGDNPVFCTINSSNQNSSIVHMSPFCNFVANVGREHGGMSWFDYKQVLIGGLGLVSTLFIVSIFGMKVCSCTRQKRHFFRVFTSFLRDGYCGFINIISIFSNAIFDYIWCYYFCFSVCMGSMVHQVAAETQRKKMKSALCVISYVNYVHISC